ncbi:unnamed protein product, partial [Diamesa tonsa]
DYNLNKKLEQLTVYNNDTRLKQSVSSIENHRIMLMKNLYNNCKHRILDHLQSISKSPKNESELSCPVRFDGWMCWGPAEPGTVVNQTCPSYIMGFDTRLTAFKTCHENGSWLEHPDTGNEWTNYTTCVNIPDMQFRQLVNDVYFYGYSLSLLTLIVSLVIFLSFRSLKCTRIRIHTQLFISLAMSCSSWLIWYKFVVADPTVIKLNPTWCISLHILLHYLMLVNYFWMFCEGLHLHLVLVVVFVKDTVAMRWFYVIGWILPVFVMIAYSVPRSYHYVDKDHCWMEESHYMWILTIPVCISLISSIVFLINVVRVLLTKLHPCSANPAPLALKKAVRATLILIPLFGLQHILLPFRPDDGTYLDRPYQILSAVLISLQGCCVSCLFCFANHDVVFALLCYMNRTFPAFFSSACRDSYYTAPATQTQSRDIVV